MSALGKAIAVQSPWNKGKLIGQKRPLDLKQIWAIRTNLDLAGQTRDLCLFNVAIDSKLRACDMVRLKVETVAPHGQTLERATVRQRKTGRPVKFEITEPTRTSIDDWLAERPDHRSGFLFEGRKGMHLSTRQYARLLDQWLA